MTTFEDQFYVTLPTIMVTNHSFASQKTITAYASRFSKFQRAFIARATGSMATIFGKWAII
uniref:Uncharacterized protein n=1 Tax=Romanomermis culicivorax TaxID=13658 RepID=A0A915HI70_ROMCU